MTILEQGLQHRASSVERPIRSLFMAIAALDLLPSLCIFMYASGACRAINHCLLHKLGMKGCRSGRYVLRPSAHV